MFCRFPIVDWQDRPGCGFPRSPQGAGKWLGLLLLLLALSLAPKAGAVILWSELDSLTVRENGPGTDLLGGAVKRDGAANDTLYFKFHVDPLSDETTEPYFAALELFEGDSERFGVGNAMDAWGYSVLFGPEGSSDSNHAARYMDLRSAKPDAVGGAPVTYERPRRGVGVTIVFKVQYVVGGDDLVTVWLNPELGPGATEVDQPESLTTRFNANAAFDELRLRHGGKGDGWTFSELAIATSFSDFVDASSARPGGAESDFARGEQALHFRSWLKGQGLPQGALRTMTQTRDGYLWLGGDTAVTRFDGVRFVSLAGSGGSSNAPVQVLLGDSGGALWIGSAGGGLKRWRDGQTRSLTTREGLPSDSVTALAEDNQGRVWIGTAGGVVLWENERVKLSSEAEAIRGHRVTALFKDLQGGIWLAAKGAGVFQSAGGKLLPVADASVQDLLRDAHCLLVDRPGRLWVGVGEDTVLCREQNVWHRYRMPKRVARSAVTTLAEEPGGTIWAGSETGGLFQFSEGKFTPVPPGSKLAGGGTGSLLVDREGKLWVGTDEGLNLLRRKSLFVLGQNEGLGFGPVQGLAQVAPGVIWAARAGDGIYRWDGRSFSRLNAAGLLAHNSQANALLVGNDGVCWVGCAGGLLRYKDPVAAADEVRWFELPGGNILALAEDGKGALWAGTGEGRVWRLEEGNWKEQGPAALTNAINAILPEADGSVWVGTEGAGLVRLGSAQPEVLGRKAGLPSELIRALYRDPQGTLWIGTGGGGLSRWQNGQMANFTSRQGLPDDTVSQILEDEAGRLWLGTGRGIVCVSKHRLEALATGKIQTLSPKLFGRADGMPAEDSTGGFCPAGLKTKSGLLWFSTGKGIALITPRTCPGDTPMPPVLLEEVLVDGVATAYTATAPLLHIAPGRHRMELHYTGLRFDAPETIRFRYKLEGWDSDWVDAGTGRSARYGFVPPGEYRFRVIACNSEGIWAVSGAELSLIFDRFFWQSWWFIGAASVAALGAVAGSVRVVEKQRMKRRLRRLEQERALEQERTRIARDLHDEMGAKLCRISFLSEHARRGGVAPAELHEQIKSISDDSRQVLHSLDEIVWAVNPQNDTLEHAASYLAQYAQDYFQSTGVECELEVPAQLPSHPVSSHVRHHLFLAVREALTNVLKHSGAARVTVSMLCADARFEVTVADNGKGFDPHTRTESPAEDSHDGLRNMAQRFKDVGGECRVDSSPGRGTTVTFILPLKTEAKPD